MMKYIFTLGIAAVLHITPAMSQKPTEQNYMEFDKLEHDFGVIKEEDGEARVRFNFTNKSDHPIWITRVETSCGCTTPEWSKDTIPPGGHGFVDAIYDTRNRLGYFSKNIMVYPNIENYYRFLKITGSVTGKPEPEFDKSLYTVSYGNLAFSKTTLNYDPLYTNEKPTTKIKIFNTAEFPITITEIMEKPDYVTLEIPNMTIKSLDSIEVTVHLDGSKVNDFTEVYSRVLFKTSDVLYPEKFLFLMMNVKEYFPKMNARELAKQPVISIADSSKNIQLGKIREGGTAKRTVMIQNTGKSDLVIHKIKPNCSCVEVSVASMTIKPGESAALGLKYDSIMQSPGVHRKWVKIISNDPKNPELSISVNMQVLD